jgi:hypothetical protein
VYVRNRVEDALKEGRHDAPSLTVWAPFYGIDPEDPAAIRLGRMTARFRATLDDKAKQTGELDAFAWPGGYPIFYVTDKDEVVCAKCANDYETGLDAFAGDGKIDVCDINYEDPELYCECGERIESAYAEDRVGQEVPE